MRAVIVVDDGDAAPTILPPKALPMMINCRSGIISDMIISVGERKNLRISRSTMANILFMAELPAGAACVKTGGLTCSSRSWRPV